MEEHPTGNYADDALFKTAELQEMRLHDYDKAIATYEELIRKFPASPLSAESSLKEAGVQARAKNEFDNALTNLQRAQKDVEQVNKENPRKNWIWKTAEKEIKFLQENKDHDWIPLTIFFAARSLKEAKEYDQVIEKLRKLLGQFPDAKVADDAELEIADCLAKSGDVDGAIAALREFAQKRGESPLRAAAGTALDAIEKKRSLEKKAK
ncbi:MAG: hypothetical protein A2Z34_05040 [Planctomycetes bacterium RBG_16_59_8]|nr:MAG: hypothetical protein A2Z34_05040 [Planctomycetes bacterium RBG_16_59_8]